MTVPLFKGPPLEEGPLPTLFYFALSDDESLNLDPFNQLVEFLKNEPIRIFSLTIPGHGPDLDPTKAISRWKELYDQGLDPLSPFFAKAAQTIEQLAAQNILSKVAVAGLSRGAFCALHIAARTPLIRTVLGFAPLTDLNYLQEFAGFTPRYLSLEPLIPKLCDRTIRFYIGNRDTRTGSENCFHLVRDLANEAYEQRIRSSPIEMIVGPSIGHKGHGTSPEVFKNGATWLKEQLL